MKVEPIQVSWSDNWMYLVTDDATKEAAVVDPWDADNISHKAKDAGVKVRQLSFNDDFSLLRAVEREMLYCLHP